MKVVPLRLLPGDDLSSALEAWMAQQQEQAGCVISGYPPAHRGRRCAPPPSWCWGCCRSGSSDESWVSESQHLRIPGRRRSREHSAELSSNLLTRGHLGSWH